MGTSREGGPRKRETTYRNWGFGPQLGDRSPKYRGRFQEVLACSYKGSIPALPRPAQGFTEQKESSTSAILEAVFYYLESIKNSRLPHPFTRGGTGQQNASTTS